MPYPRFVQSRSHKVVLRTAGNVPVTTTWSFVEGMTLTLQALAGDVMQAGLSGLWGSEATAGRLDFLIVDSIDTVLSSFSGTYASTSTGVPAWHGQSGATCGVGAPAMRTLVETDIIDGLVRMRLVVRCDASTKTLNASATDPLQLWVQNLGPVAPG